MKLKVFWCFIFGEATIKSALNLWAAEEGIIYTASLPPAEFISTFFYFLQLKTIFIFLFRHFYLIGFHILSR